MNITYEFLPGWRKVDCLLSYCSPGFRFLPKVIITELENGLIELHNDTDVFRVHGKQFSIKPISEDFIKSTVRPDVSLVILSNQIKATALGIVAIKIKLEQFIKRYNINVLALFALKPNRYAKPCTGMWKFLHAYYRTKGQATITAALLVSNNGGRTVSVKDKVKCDKADFDRAFAHNCDIKYMSISEYLNKTTERFEWSRKYIPPEARLALIDKINSTEQLDIMTKVNPAILNIICVYGAPRSGKSTYIGEVIEKFNEQFNDANLLPVIDTTKRAFKRAESILRDENSVIVEGNCHTAALRYLWGELAKKYTANLIFVEVDPGISLSHIFNYAAVEKASNEHIMLYPDAAYYTYKSDLEPPDTPLIYHPRIITDDVICKYRF
jgi:DNA 3'-phosphatase